MNFFSGNGNCEFISLEKISRENSKWKSAFNLLFRWGGSYICNRDKDPQSYWIGRIKGALQLEFWWIEKELSHGPSRPCESVALVWGRFGDFLSIINFKINFSTSLKIPKLKFLFQTTNLPPHPSLNLTLMKERLRSKRPWNTMASSFFYMFLYLGSKSTWLICVLASLECNKVLKSWRIFYLFLFRTAS